jgi:hypothetical protein
MEQKIYYVYGLIDPDTQLPFYIGKGKDDRAYSHLKLMPDDHYNPRKRSHIERLLSENKNIEVRFFENDLTSREANDEEMRLIRHYGRINFDPGGILTNLTRGGEGGDTSAFFTAESRRKISQAISGVNNPRSKLTEEQVREIYHSCESIKILSKKYPVGAGQIKAIKRKQYYKSIVESIADPPGYFANSRERVALTDQDIRQIFLEENTYEYFHNKYKISRQTLRSIKTRKVFAKVTADLGAAGHVKKYKLSNDDTNDIYNSPLSLQDLAEKYHIHIETVRNIKNVKTRKFIQEPY